jgi:nitrogen fixation NifU-like protein
MSINSIYGQEIIERYNHPTNFGELENADFTRRDSNPLCGDDIVLQLKIDDKKISDVKFKYGAEDKRACSICTATTSVLTDMIKGKDIEFVKTITKEKILSSLGLEHLDEYSPIRIKCALLSLKILKLLYYYDLAKRIGDTEDTDKLKDDATTLY